MSETIRSYRLASGAGEDEWFDTLDAAEAVVASRIGIDAAGIQQSRRRVTADPVVIRRDGARWRSAGMWIYRSSAASARVFEMVRVDEAAYDH